MDRSLPLPNLEDEKCEATDNLLLARVAGSELQEIIAATEHVSLLARTPLYEQGERIRYVYFFTSGIASASAVMQDGRSAEVVCVGREGFLGLPMLLEGSKSWHRCWMQIGGAACRLDAAEFRRLVSQSDRLPAILGQYATARMFESAQLCACNVLHSVEQRLCRWLLLAHVRTRSNQLPVTHELLADNLGAQRTTVSMVAGNLERAGLIAYKRGQVRIVNAAGLQATACECFRVIRDRYAGLR